MPSDLSSIIPIEPLKNDFTATNTIFNPYTRKNWNFVVLNTSQSLNLPPNEIPVRTKKPITELSESDCRKMFGDLINHAMSQSEIDPTRLPRLIIRMTELIVTHPEVGGRIEELALKLNRIKKTPSKDSEMFKLIWKFRQNVKLASTGPTMSIDPPWPKSLVMASKIIDWAVAIDTRNNRPYLSNYGPIVVRSLSQTHKDIRV